MKTDPCGGAQLAGLSSHIPSGTRPSFQPQKEAEAV